MNIESLATAPAALFSLGVAIFHLAFARLFNWKSDLPKLKRVNRSIMKVLNLALIVLLILLAVLLLSQAVPLAMTPLGNIVLVGLATFWFARAVMQPLYFGVHKVSIAFTGLWLLGSTVHLLPLFVLQS